MKLRHVERMACVEILAPSSLYTLPNRGAGARRTVHAAQRGSAFLSLIVATLNHHDPIKYACSSCRRPTNITVER